MFSLFMTDVCLSCSIKCMVGFEGEEQKEMLFSDAV